MLPSLYALITVLTACFLISGGLVLPTVCSDYSTCCLLLNFWRTGVTHSMYAVLAACFLTLELSVARIVEGRTAAIVYTPALH